jgi:CheY-like chemotaxis protein
LIGDIAKSCTVLVVDDHRDTLNVMARLFRKQGYSVVTAASVGEAIHIVRCTPPDVAMLDIHLPDGDGCDLLKTLRQLVGPIGAVAVTGLAMHSDVQRIRAAGFDAHVIKPVHLHELNAALAKACALRHQKSPSR